MSRVSARWFVSGSNAAGEPGRISNLESAASMAVIQIRFDSVTTQDWITFRVLHLEFQWRVWPLHKPPFPRRNSVKIFIRSYSFVTRRHETKFFSLTMRNGAVS